MTRSSPMLALAMIAVVLAAPSARAAEPPPIESTRIEAPKIEPQQIAIDTVASFSITAPDSFSIIAVDSLSAIAQTHAPPLGAAAALDSVAPSIESNAWRSSRSSIRLHQPTARSSLNRSSIIAAAALTRHRQPAHR